MTPEFDAFEPLYQPPPPFPEGELATHYFVVKVPPAGAPTCRSYPTIEAVRDYLSAQVGESNWCFVIAGGERLPTTRPPDVRLVMPDGRQLPVVRPPEQAEIDLSGAMFDDTLQVQEALPPILIPADGGS